ncbi:rhodopsin, GQ-coupled-like [Babylonia areolata]|uniref:rhodopsin, GQ-coupled-like n=1 Tax=Babylonia areolata TaxID=304850 RepID=UPI003FCFBD4D
MVHEASSYPPVSDFTDDGSPTVTSGGTQESAFLNDTGPPLSAVSYTVIAIYMTLASFAHVNPYVPGKSRLISQWCKSGGVSVVGNVMLAVIMAQSGAWRTPAVNLYVFTIVIASIIESISGFPLVIASNFRGRWMFGELGCTYYAFVTYTCVLVAMTCYLLVCVYRYRVVVQHVPANSPETRRWVTVSIVAAWTYALCWSVCPFLGWGAFAPEPFATSCSLDWTTRVVSNKMYNVLVFLFLLLIPVTVMISCSIVIMKKVRMQVRPSIPPLDNHQNNINTANNSRDGTSSEGASIQTRSLKILLLTMVMFVLFWTPYGVLSLLAGVGMEVDAGLSAVPTIMAKTHCAVNPIVYFVCFHKYRYPIRLLLGMDVN